MTAADRPHDIFISYRRDGGFETARYLYDRLTWDGYHVTFDLDSLRNGRFDEALLGRIDECTDFVIVLSKGCFDRTLDPGFPRENDWMRRELGYAIGKKKNVIPVLLGGYEHPANLPSDIDEVCLMNGPPYSREYIDAFYLKLKDFMRTPPPEGGRMAEAGASRSPSPSVASPLPAPASPVGDAVTCAKCHRWRRLTEMFACERCGKNYCLEHQDKETYLCGDCAVAVREEETRQRASSGVPQEGGIKEVLERISAGGGEAERLFQKGLDAFEGRGVEQNDEEAVRCWRQAAERGSARAQFSLGAMYDEGRGVEQSDREAAAWYRKAAEQGDAVAQFNLGTMYDEGRGVEQNDREAAAWYRKAAEQGDAGAQGRKGGV